ncbi:hypothetical protein YK48G_05050 [Lentilactobacillus fungorum]|jgi:hypothetical protein|uniref:Uncharacterized protein n=1 Tax=Lentilactobacillus fungorum TaxID=2201250 RepID=A0ABQ3VX17_9LACO|nr:hypothetical protein [Lentilactobacillus fungorum]GHP13080.1 hypothetical protein YK48G_05050 [Lentilactobacillus fungorum]
MKNESNYDLFQRLHPHCFAEAMVARFARNELERRAANGDGEAKMLLALNDCENNESQSLHLPSPRRTHIQEPQRFKLIYHLRLR